MAQDTLTARNPPQVTRLRVEATEDGGTLEIWTAPQGAYRAFFDAAGTLLKGEILLEGLEEGWRRRPSENTA
ncbi:MAG TPA: hypothetical protein VKT32_01650 [Chthonomonadaceae bacterium]|nr:hypothetical protein [Chthonomonadaceae bacterium]